MAKAGFVAMNPKSKELRSEAGSFVVKVSVTGQERFKVHDKGKAEERVGIGESKGIEHRVGTQVRSLS